MIFRPLDDPRLTAEHLQVVYALLGETTDWAAQSFGSVTTAQLIALVNDPLSIWRAVFEDDALVGLIGIVHINWIDKVCEPVIAIVPERRKTGAGYRIGMAFLRYVLDQLGMRRIQSTVLANAPSRHLLEKMGFVQEGVLPALRWKDGDYIDGILYGWRKE